MRKVTATKSVRSDDEFPGLAEAVKRQLSRAVGPLFWTAPPVPLFYTYLENLQEEGERKAHDCHCCRRFLEQYGSLVTIDATGRQVSALWDAMEREFFEETGVTTSGWIRFARFYGDAERQFDVPNYEVHCFFWVGDIAACRTMTEEVVGRFAVCDVGYLRASMPNIKWLIPMALSVARGETKYKYFQIEET